MIKLIAIAAMVVDHLPRIVWGDPLIWTTAVGRLAFPAFAFLAARGAIHTGRPWRYIGLLVLFGVLAQPIHTFILLDGQLVANVLFTLALGVLCIHDWRWLPVVAVAGLGVEYGVFGVLLVWATGECWRCHTYDRQSWPWAVAIGSLAVMQPLTWWPVAMATWAACWMLQAADWSREVDRRLSPQWARLGFYAFYPLHIAAIGMAASMWG